MTAHLGSSAPQKALKRIFDFLAAAVLLFLLSPLLFLITLWIRSESRGPVFFRQKRIGQNFKPFTLYKFRTMLEVEGPSDGVASTQRERITSAGAWLRRLKWDEFPQLLNILKGEMSFVGPRPEIERFVAIYRSDYAELLTVKPGLSDLASLKYRNEQVLLNTVNDPEAYYIERLLPDKIRISKEYLVRSSAWTDILILLKTLVPFIPLKL
jgi:lipopolysaccharide/colanic/teichoic acid biosynthesis glycosyltransferase